MCLQPINPNPRPLYFIITQYCIYLLVYSYLLNIQTIASLFGDDQQTTGPWYCQLAAIYLHRIPTLEALDKIQECVYHWLGCIRYSSIVLIYSRFLSDLSVSVLGGDKIPEWIYKPNSFHRICVPDKKVSRFEHYLKILTPLLHLLILSEHTVPGHYRVSVIAVLRVIHHPNFIRSLEFLWEFLMINGCE